MLFPHFEIFAEVLVTTPPVQVDHTEALNSQGLMEVGVPDVVLFAVCWETAIFNRGHVAFVSITYMPSPVFAHPFLGVFSHGV